MGTTGLTKLFAVKSYFSTSQGFKVSFQHRIMAASPSESDYIVSFTVSQDVSAAFHNVLS